MRFLSLHRAKGGAHKIILGLFLFSALVILLAVLFTKSMTSAANRQLALIAKNNFPDAYQLTSKIYQDKVSFDKFAAYLQKYPVLRTHEPVKFLVRKSQGTAGYLSGTIIGADHQKMLIEFELLKENHSWKINDMRLSAIGEIPTTAAPAADSSGASIHGILISDSVDKKGYVDLEKVILPKTTTKIYATVQIVSPKSGALISATLINTNTGGKIGPQTATVAKAVDTLKTFYFNRSGTAWQAGDYQVAVTLSTGAAQSVKFRIE